MSARKRSLAVILVVLSALAIGGCSHSGQKFSSSESDNALATVDDVQAAVEDGKCNSADVDVQKLIDQAQRINADRPDLGAAYAKSVNRLQQLVTSECKAPKKTVEPTEAVTAPTSEPSEPVTKPNPTPATPQPDPTGGGATPEQTTPDDQTPDQGSGGVGPNG